MLQTHQQLKMISLEYNSLFSKNEFYPLQKAYTTPHFLVLAVRFPGKSVAIYIGRGNQYQGIFIADKLPPAYLRVQDRLLDYIRKYLVGARLGKMEVDEKNMVSFFNFKNEQPENTFLFGYKDRQLFFAKKSENEIYTSWSGQTIESTNLLSLVDSFDPDKMNNSQVQSDWGIPDYLLSEEKKMCGKPIQRKKEKFLTRKIKNIAEDLDGAKKWSLLQEDLNQNRLELDLDELKVYGQKIKFFGLSSLWLKRDLVFKKIKKLKKAESILSTRLENSLTEFENVKVGNFEFEVSKEKVIQPLWITHQKQVNAENKEYNIKNFKILNLTGVMGLDASSNDWIRAQGSKDHYWFHIENYTSAHCIIKSDNLSQITPEVLTAIASLLRDYSRLEIREIPVIYTQLKNIKGVKGSKGMVTVKKPKYLRCLYLDWKEIISII